VPNLPCLVLDLDGTLFNKHRTRTFAQLDSNAVGLVADLLGVDHGRAEEVMRSYLRQHGSTIQGLLRSNLEFCVETFLHRLHDVDISDIDRNHELRDTLAAIPHTVYVYTNSCRHYATRILEQVGIHDLVEGVFDIRMAGLVSKPSTTSLDAFLKHFDLRAVDCLFVDDSKPNLQTGKHYGMTTIYINDSDDYDTEHFIDYATTDLPGLLRSLCLDSEKT
jgi:putative hydrolase of the HAD superfamily